MNPAPWGLWQYVAVLSMIGLALLAVWLALHSPPADTATREGQR